MQKYLDFFSKVNIDLHYFEGAVFKNSKWLT